MGNGRDSYAVNIWLRVVFSLSCVGSILRDFCSTSRTQFQDTPCVIFSSIFITAELPVISITKTERSLSYTRHEPTHGAGLRLRGSCESSRPTSIFEHHYHDWAPPRFVVK